MEFPEPAWAHKGATRPLLSLGAEEVWLDEDHEPGLGTLLVYRGGMFLTLTSDGGIGHDGQPYEDGAARWWSGGSPWVWAGPYGLVRTSVAAWSLAGFEARRAAETAAFIRENFGWAMGEEPAGGTDQDDPTKEK
jgi:hypothetical protein